MKARTEPESPYVVDVDQHHADDAAIAYALAILERRLRTVGAALSSPQAIRDYLRLHADMRDGAREHFLCIYLDAQNRAISIKTLFSGTLTQTSVFPREVVREALACNAASVVFAHNHPSGLAEPSRADELLTQSLRQSLILVDVKVLDHFIVGRDSIMSFAERGLL